MTTRPVTRFDDATASISNVDRMMAVVLGAAAAWVGRSISLPNQADAAAFCRAKRRRIAKSGLLVNTNLG